MDEDAPFVLSLCPFDIAGIHSFADIAPQDSPLRVQRCLACGLERRWERKA